MPDDFQGKNVLITISGPDHPGITSRLMKIVSQDKTTIKDIGQSVTHGLLSLSFVIEIGDDENVNSHVIKDLLFEAYKMGMSLDYKIVDDESFDDSLEVDKFILNCVAPESISSSFVYDISSTLANHNVNINRIDKVSPREFSSLEILTTVPKSLNQDLLKEELLGVSNIHKVDVAFLKDNVFRRSKRLIVFDMDSTLIQTEVIDELAEAHGVGEKIKAITERAMNGELDFNESLIEHVGMLKGLDSSKMQDILENLPLTPGLEDFLKTVKKLGYKVAVISGGFTYFANALKDRLGLDYAFANELEIQDGQLTGKVVGTIVNAEQKAILVNLIAQQENISIEQVVAIGDGANDLPMLSQAGLGIAFHAKDIVKRKAQNHMSHGPMTSILYFLGIPGPVNS